MRDDCRCNDTSERISWHPNVIIGSVSSGRRYYLWSWYCSTFNVRMNIAFKLHSKLSRSQSLHSTLLSWLQSSSTECYWYQIEDRLQRSVGSPFLVVKLKLNPVVPISNRKLFRFCSSLGRASHFHLHPTDEVLLRTQSAALYPFPALCFRSFYL